MGQQAPEITSSPADSPCTLTIFEGELDHISFYDLAVPLVHTHTHKSKPPKES